MTQDTITVAGRRIYAPSRDPLAERDLPTQARLRATVRAWEARKRELLTDDICHPQQVTFDTRERTPDRVS
jgi:hypothetical protein